MKHIISLNVIFYLLICINVSGQFYLGNFSINEGIQSTQDELELIEDIESSFNIEYAVDFSNGSKVILGKYYRQTSSDEPMDGIPNTFTNIFLDENNTITRVRPGSSNLCGYGNIIYATVLEATNELLIIGYDGEAYLQKNASEEGFGDRYCRNQNLSFGHNNYQNVRTTKVIRTNNFLTVLSEAKDADGIVGTLQTIIKIDTYEQINNFFTPLPSQEFPLYKMTGLQYITPDSLVVSYSTIGRDTLKRDLICYLDRQRNILSTIELDKNLYVLDLILKSDSGLILSGQSDDFADLRAIDFEGNIKWQIRDTIDTANSIFISSFNSKVIRTPDDELLIARINEGVTANFVSIKCFNQNNNTFVSSSILGNTPYGYSLRDLYVTDQDNILLLTNYRHTGSNIGYYFDVELAKNTISVQDTDLDKSTFCFPNPFSNSLHLRLQAGINNQESTYEILTLDGRLAMKGNTQTVINTASLYSGVYVLKIYHQEKTYSQKIVCTK